MKISIIIPCKGRFFHLVQSLATIKFQTINPFEVIVVDYGCPDLTFERINGWNSKYIRAIQASGDTTKFNLSRARNEGYKHASGDVLFFCDADTILAPYFLEIHANGLERGMFYCGWGHHDSTGNCIVWRDIFEHSNIRGYNELMQGWGFEDIDFYNRCEASGFERRPFIGGTSSIQHGDEDRVMYYDMKDKQANNDANAQIKEHKGI